MNFFPHIPFTLAEVEKLLHGVKRHPSYTHYGFYPAADNAKRQGLSAVGRFINPVTGKRATLYALKEQFRHFDGLSKVQQRNHLIQYALERELLPGFQYGVLGYQNGQVVYPIDRDRGEWRYLPESMVASEGGGIMLRLYRPTCWNQPDGKVPLTWRPVVVSLRDPETGRIDRYVEVATAGHFNLPLKSNLWEVDRLQFATATSATPTRPHPAGRTFARKPQSSPWSVSRGYFHLAIPVAYTEPPRKALPLQRKPPRKPKPIASVRLKQPKKTTKKTKP